MERMLAFGAALLLLGIAFFAPVAAQDATPGVRGSGRLAAAELGVEELLIQVSDAGISMPTAAPAGRYLLILDNRIPDDAFGVDLVRPPADIAIAEARAAVVSAEAGESALPPWVYDATWAGGPFATDGGTGQSIVDLAPGDWVVWAGGTGLPPRVLAVTADAGGVPTASDPEASTAVELREYDFVGLDQGVPAGPQVRQVTNTGDQPHVLDLAKAPGPITVEQMMEIFSLPDGTTPTPGTPSYAEFEPMPAIGGVSPGQTAWLVLPDLAPGTYVATCFVPDREAGAPHAVMGMIRVFTVGETGTPTP